MVAISSASVIGVACRYNTSGCVAKISVPAIAAAMDPVILPISQNNVVAASTNSATDIATADRPVRYSQSCCTGSMFSRCGSGSHTAPTCHHPGRSESMIRRATTRWAFAS